MTDKTEQEVQEYLKKCGFNISKIIENEYKTPDFKIEDTTNILMEVKRIETSEKIKNALDDETGITSFSELLKHGSSLETRIRNGIKQLNATNSDSLKLIWIHTESPNFNAIREQILSFLYGMQFLTGDSKEGKDLTGRYYYFNNSCFYRRSDKIDGVVFTSNFEEFPTLMVNDLSSKYGKLIRTKLFATFLYRQYHFGIPIIDPSEQSKLNAGIYKVDKCDITGNEGGTLKKLRERYESSNLGIVEMYSFSSFFQVKK